MRLGTNLASAALLVLLTGCSSGTTPLVVPPPNAPIGLPAPAAPGSVNTYSGAQSPGAWSLTLDNSKDMFNYQPVTYPTPVAGGTLQSSEGFSVLSNSALAYEVLGRAAVLRPGDSTNEPVFAVPQTQCYVVTGRLRFQYIAMFAGAIGQNGGPDTANGAPLLGYGSVVASTDTTGANWQFTNLQGGLWAPTESTPASIVAGPDSFTGNCAAVNGQAFIQLSGSSLLDTFWTPNPTTTPTPATVSTIWIGPSGFFIADQSDPTQSMPTGVSVAGVAEPSAPLSTSDINSHTYLGILYLAANGNNYGNGAPPFPASTMPVGFGQVMQGTKTTMTGGIFPNGSLSTAPNTDTQISLGAQDGTLNGLYPSVSITVPDPAQNCANFTLFPLPGITGNVNAQGYPTCTFPGVAVAGKPEGNYAIFINSYNWAVQFGGAPMQLYLFQQ